MSAEMQRMHGGRDEVEEVAGARDDALRHLYERLNQ